MFYKMRREKMRKNYLTKTHENSIKFHYTNPAWKNFSSSRLSVSLSNVPLPEKLSSALIYSHFAMKILHCTGTTDTLWFITNRDRSFVVHFAQKACSGAWSTMFNMNLRWAIVQQKLLIQSIKLSSTSPC